MIESLLYSVNVVVPILLIALLGYLLKRIGFAKSEFYDTADKLVFRVCLPALLFNDIAVADGTVALDLRFVLFCICSVLGMTAVAVLISLAVTESNEKRGALVQGMYRSNAAILGTMLIKSMFDNSPEANSLMAMTLPFVVILFNIIAVCELSIFAPREKKLAPSALVRKIIRSIATNPLIIAIFLGLVCRALLTETQTELPPLAASTLAYLSNMAVPLSLLSLGASISLESMKSRIGYALLASVMKTVILPWGVIGLALAFGMRGIKLGIVFVIFGGPAAVSSYIMAKNMGSDHILAGQILMLTTVLSCLTNFLGIFVLKYFALI